MTNEERIEAFRKLLERHYASPEDYDEDCEEDPRPFLAGDEPLAEWVSVTEHNQKRFLYPRYRTAAEAISRSIEYITDDLYDEKPVCVVSLDTGEERWPDWGSLRWRIDRKEKVA